MATQPATGIPGIPSDAIADADTGNVTPAWRSFFVMMSRLSGAACTMLGVSAQSVPNSTPTYPLLVNAANDAAAAAAGVPKGGFYRTTNAVQQRLV